MSSPTVELVQFRLRPGVTEEAFLAAVATSQAAIERLPGFISRAVLRAEGDVWVDLVHWRTEREALAAADTFGSLPEVAELVSAIDMEQVQMLHLAQLRAYAAPATR